MNEITASYSVDEQQLEIRLKIPADWPLHKIEIRDVKKVGVDENRWRAWVFGVQQIVWAQVSQFPLELGKDTQLNLDRMAELWMGWSY